MELPIIGMLGGNYMKIFGKLKTIIEAIATAPPKETLDALLTLDTNLK